VSHLPFVHIWVSDPWEFGTDCGVGPFRATVARLDERALVARLDSPFEYKKKRWTTVTAVSRHEGQTPTDLLRGETMFANLLFSTREVDANEARRAEDPQFAAVGSVEPVGLNVSGRPPILRRLLLRLAPSLVPLQRCLCCDNREIEERGRWEICAVCGWEDDPVQCAHPDFTGGANDLSLNQARARWMARDEA
jgi:hypothetical protein